MFYFILCINCIEYCCVNVAVWGHVCDACVCYRMGWRWFLLRRRWWIQMITLKKIWVCWTTRGVSFCICCLSSNWAWISHGCESQQQPERRWEFWALCTDFAMRPPPDRKITFSGDGGGCSPVTTITPYLTLLTTTHQYCVILALQFTLKCLSVQVVLPTFILEKRSLLEMYANFMAHPDLFLSISDGSTPEERMVRFVEYYMTAFHEGRKGAVAKKPYNPVLGETFHCSWEIPQDRVCPLRTETNPRTNQEATGAGSDCYRVRFVAEQVSHHPPVSGFYCECAERGMCVNTHIWTKSKFIGMSVGVSMVGEGGSVFTRRLQVNFTIKGIIHAKTKISWKCTHPQAIQDVDEFISSSDLEKCSITSLAQQWILCSEWVPSEWESKQLIKTSQ